MIALLSLGGCVDNDVSLSISKFIGPAADATGCELDPSTNSHAQRGIYDLAIARYARSGYFLGFVVENNLPTVAMAPIETQAYFVSSFDIELEPEGAATAAIPEERRKFSYKVGTIRLVPGTDAAASAEVVPPELIDSLAGITTANMGLVNVRIRASATRAEEEQHTAYATFPIQFCKGCLLGASFNNGALAQCPLPEGTVALAPNPCGVAQDQPADCCEVDSDTIACGPGAVAKPAP